jgi:hypothetical protein
MRNALRRVCEWLRYRCALRAFLRIECDGAHMIVAPEEAPAILLGAADDECYRMSVVWMTKHGFDRLPEFSGF